MVDNGATGALPADSNGTVSVSPVVQDRFAATIAKTFGPRNNDFSRAYEQLKTVQKLTAAQAQAGFALQSNSVGLLLVDVVKNARPSEGLKDVNPDRQLVLSAWIAARVCAYPTIRTLLNYAEDFIPDLKKGDESLARACVAISHKMKRGVFFDELVASAKDKPQETSGKKSPSQKSVTPPQTVRVYLDRNPGSEEILVGFWAKCASEIKDKALRLKVTEDMKRAVAAAKPDLDARLVMTARLFSQTKNEEIVSSFGSFTREIFDQAAEKGHELRDSTLAETCWTLAANVTKVDRGKGIRKSYADFWNRCATSIKEDDLRGQVARSMYLVTSDDSPAHHVARMLLGNKKDLYEGVRKSRKGNRKPQPKGKKQAFRPDRGLPRRNWSAAEAAI